MIATTSQQLKPALALVLCLATITGQVLAGAVSDQSFGSANQFDSPALKVISDEDRTLMQYVKTAIDNNYSNLKDFDDVYKLLSNVKLLVQKHPKNVAFAQGDLEELHKFLSQELVTRLIRVDTEPFDNVQNEEGKVEVAQRAVADDELTGKLFGAPLRSLVEAKRQEQHRQQQGSNHRDGNFFSNFWCKLSGNCSS